MVKAKFIDRECQAEATGLKAKLVYSKMLIHLINTFC